jgi:hypothetical protein
VSLSQCGKRYKTRETAANSKLAGKPGAVVTEHQDHWHVRFPGRKRKALRSRKPARGNVTAIARNTRPMVRNAGTGSAQWKKLGSGLKPFPRKVAVLITERDEFCQRCGSAGPLHRHHRRAKGMGGDTRAHTQCACNGLLLCSVDIRTGEIGGCHLWAHLHPKQAKAEGFIVEEDEAEPGRVSVSRGTEDGGGATMWPTCDGQWASESPWTEAAA